MHTRLRLIDRVTGCLLALALLGSFVIAVNAQKRKPVYYSSAVNRTLRVRLNDSIGSDYLRLPTASTLRFTSSQFTFCKKASTYFAAAAP